MTDDELRAIEERWESHRDADLLCCSEPDMAALIAEIARLWVDRDAWKKLALDCADHHDAAHLPMGAV